MPASFFFRAPNRLKPLRAIFTIAALILISTAFLTAQQPNPTPAPKAAPEKPTTDASASRQTLAQFNDALEDLAAKVSPAVVQILVTGYGPLHEESRTQTALIVRQNAVGVENGLPDCTSMSPRGASACAMSA